MRLLRPITVIASVLLCAHVVALLAPGNSSTAGLISDLVQLGLGVIVAMAALQAAKRSAPSARYIWRLVALSYGIWLLAQTLAVYSDFVSAAAISTTFNDICFTFWFAPLGLALFLDLESESFRISSTAILDFTQGILFWVAAYEYFVRFPSDSNYGTELAHSVWPSLFAYYGILIAALWLRRFLVARPETRAALTRVVIILLVSSSADALYFYGPGHSEVTGASFDLLWSISLFVPALVAASWKPEPAAEPTLPAERPRVGMLEEIFPLLYPLLIFGMSARIELGASAPASQRHFTLEGAVVLLSFLCCCARLLVTQHQLIKTQGILTYQATHDALTSTLNRRAISESLTHELDRAQRNGGSVGVILGDLDHFKAINDTYGHQVGDAVLQLVSSTLAEGLRSYDLLGRYGGEEFLIILPGAGLEGTYEIADRLRKAVADVRISLDDRQVTISMGIACSLAPSDAGEVMRAADAALYAAKSGGRNRVAVSAEGLAIPVPAAPGT